VNIYINPKIKRPLTQSKSLGGPEVYRSGFDAERMRYSYHVEREFSGIPMNFLWFEYHQIRFISFGIWFLGLFLTDFTAIVVTPDDGWRDVLQYIKVISIIHLIFISAFLVYLLFRHWTDSNEADAPNWKMIIHSMFDMSLHLDIAALIFSVCFYDHRRNSIFIWEVLIVIDALLCLVLTPFKRWRAFVDLFGALPSVILAHFAEVKHEDYKVSYFPMFIPMALILLCPLIFSICVLINSQNISRFAIRCIKFMDPSLLPNMMVIQKAQQVHLGANQPPSIHDRATSGSESDYFDFKSVPMAIAATFFIHFGGYASGWHENTMVVMAHYFLMLAGILINTRVVAFPAIILTNVSDASVQFNSVWPELSFV
jgi:hypothetical protein